MLTLLTGWKGFGFSAHITALLRAYSQAKLELQRSLGKGFEKIDSLWVFAEKLNFVRYPETEICHSPRLKQLKTIC